MRTGKGLLLLAVIVLSVPGLLPGQSKDLSGTWIGDTVIPNNPDRDLITLVLKKEGASYSGTVSDSMGMANASALEKVKSESDTLSFEFVITANDQNIRIRTTLKVSGEKLVGSWESEQGESGPLELARKK